MIEIEKVSQKHKNYKYKILFYFFIFSIIVLITIIVVHIEFSNKNNLKKFNTESQLQSKEKIIFLNSFLQKRQDSLTAIRDNPYFREFAANGIYPHNTDFLFFTMMQENKEYMQIRFLDIDGKEQLRFDRKNYGETAYKVASLQDKSNRYYFKKTITLKDNQIFFSKIDFNMEKGEIQKPYIPVLRVGTPVYINQELKGILIVNIFIDNFIKLFTSSPIYDISLVDCKGYLIKNKHNYFDKTKHIDTIFDKSIVSKILKTEDYSIIFDKNIFIKKTNIGNQRIFIIYKSKVKNINELRKDDIKMTAIILLLTIFISIPFAFLLSRPINDMFEIVMKQSDKLHDLATTLDKKVEEESLKNAKKDRLLQHQSKMAELGDMIGNIAHQWRHPLTRLSLLLQNLKAYKNKNKMTNEIFSNTLISVDEQIEFMSTTIDNFKNFYKTDKVKDTFKIQDCVDDILKIIGSVLEHNNIKFTVKDDEEIELFGIKNELSQVLLNLIVNAKDALEEHKVLTPYITIKIYQKKNKKIISIEDNAGGISKSIVGEIFNPYFTTKEKKGTGIGLYLSRTIIEQDFNGKLNVKNNDNGAIFTIIL